MRRPSFDLPWARFQVAAALSEGNCQARWDADGVITVPLNLAPVHIMVVEPDCACDRKAVLMIWAVVSQGLRPSRRLFECLASLNVELTFGRLAAIRDDESVSILAMHNLPEASYTTEQLRQAVVAISELAYGCSDWMSQRFGRVPTPAEFLNL